MRYLIMECALSYAVALDEEGRFCGFPTSDTRWARWSRTSSSLGRGEVLEFGPARREEPAGVWG